MLASDSLLTFYTQDGPSLQWEDGGYKIISNGIGLFGAGGNLSTCQEFLRWILEDEMAPDKFPKVEKGELNGVGIIDGEIFEWTNSCKPFTIRTEYMPWGGGKEVATGALAAGAGAIETLDIACKYSPGTGYPIQVLIEEALDGTVMEPFILSRDFVKENKKQLFKLTGIKLFEFLTETLNKQATKKQARVPVVPVKRRGNAVPKAKRK